MRRARIQIKPNIAKAAKQTPTQAANVETPALLAPAAVTPPEPELLQNPENEPVSDNQKPLNIPPESLELHVDVVVKPTVTSYNNHHVHFGADVIDNEQTTPPLSSQISQSGLQSPQFVVPQPPSRLMTPRSRNVSMCEDESILQPKQPREKKRFTGKEELDTKTWKMSDLARWNPRNEHTSFKRERRSSTSSTIITKSECGGDVGEVPPLPRINAPQVKIGLDGKLVIDETSLLVQSAQLNHESVWETVEEGRIGSKITSMSFRNRIFRKPNIWTDKETDLFYEVLRCTGQDFGLMHHYLPQRSRPELKAKYNREEKCHWPRLFQAISHPVRLDKDLETRISRYLAEMEEEAREKKERTEYEKAEEKRVRAAIRENQLLERQEERLKKQQAKELLRQARELEKGAKMAAKTTERAEKVKEKLDARILAVEAKRVATEAREIIKETRKQEKNERKDKANADQDSLEREAERIIRRLIQESRREERLKQKLKQAAGKQAKKNISAESSSASRTSNSVVPDDVVDPYESGPDLGDTTSDSSTTASSSDEEALKRDTARKEKARMKEERRNLEPRKTVVEKKPVYVDKTDMKYAQQPISRAIEMAKAANGNMFHSADEQDVFDPPASMDLEPSTAPPAEVIAREKEMDEEPVPQAVTDVIEDIIRERSKTPMEIQQKELDSNEGKNRKKKNIEKSKDLKKAVEKEKRNENICDEPAAKISRMDDGSFLIDVAEIVEIETSVDADTSANIQETVSQEPSTSNAPLLPQHPPTRRTVKKPVAYKKKN